MPSSEKHSTFIIATSHAQGAWYPNRPAALSVINSHAASLKAEQGREKERLSGDHAKNARAQRNRPSKYATFRVSTRNIPPLKPEPQIETEDAATWSLDELKDIFDVKSPIPTPNTSSLSDGTQPYRSFNKVGDAGLCEGHQDNDYVPQQSSFATDVTTYVSGREYSKHDLSQGVTANVLDQVGSLRLKDVDHDSGGDSQATHRNVLLRRRSSNLRQIQTTLDPFMRLSIAVSAKEQGLLHFYLTEGRQALIGSTSLPAYCPTLYVANRGAMQRSAAYVQTHIVMAEYILCKLQATHVSANFFRRRAEAYKTVSSLLSDGNTTFDDQVFGLVNLQVAEWVLRRRDLQSMHLKALHGLVEQSGGIYSTFLTRIASSGSMMEPMFYTTQYMFAEYTMESQGDLLQFSVHRFCSDLRSIRNWILQIQGLTPESHQSPSVDFEQRRRNKETVRLVSQYLQTTLHLFTHSRDIDHHLLAGVFLLVLNLVLTYQHYEMSIEQCLAFLISLQVSLAQSIDLGESTRQDDVDRDKAVASFHRPHPIIAICLIAHLRRELPMKSRANVYSQTNTSDPIHEHRGATDRHLDDEVLIAESSINALMLVPMMTSSTRARLMRALARCALVVTDLTTVEGLSDPELEEVRAELLSNRSDGEQEEAKSI